LCSSRRATLAAGPSLPALHKSGRRRYDGADSAAGRRRWRRVLAAGAAAGCWPPVRRRMPDAVICRPAVAEPAESTQGAVPSPKRPAACCCFVAVAGRVAGRGADAVGC